MITLNNFLSIVDKDFSIKANSDMHKLMHVESERARKITAKINGCKKSQKQIRTLMTKLTGKVVDNNLIIFPPFYTDFGKNITFGKNVFINTCCCFQDQGGITIGDNALIGHQVVFATLNHELKPNERADMLPKPIIIGKNVWIGSHATILPGIKIGDNAVVAAGAVVTRDVLSNTVVGGIPAKTIKTI